MLKQILLISLIALCILAKKHKQTPDLIKKCLIDNCQEQLDTCGTECIDKVEYCYSKEENRHNCWGTAKIRNLYMCVGMNCSDFIPYTTKHSSKVAHKLGRNKH